VSDARTEREGRASCSRSVPHRDKRSRACRSRSASSHIVEDRDGPWGGGGASPIAHAPTLCNLVAGREGDVAVTLGDAVSARTQSPPARRGCVARAVEPLPVVQGRRRRNGEQARGFVERRDVRHAGPQRSRPGFVDAVYCAARACAKGVAVASRSPARASRSATSAPRAPRYVRDATLEFDPCSPPCCYPCVPWPSSPFQTPGPPPPPPPPHACRCGGNARRPFEPGQQVPLTSRSTAGRAWPPTSLVIHHRTPVVKLIDIASVRHSPNITDLAQSRACRSATAMLPASVSLTRYSVLFRSHSAARRHRVRTSVLTPPPSPTNPTPTMGLPTPGRHGAHDAGRSGRSALIGKWQLAATKRDVRRPIPTRRLVRRTSAR
jgi:hypothetical protein